MIDDMIKVKVKVDRQFFPKNKKIESGEYAIASVSVIDTIEGNPETSSKWGTLSVKGIMCAWEYGEVYTLIAKQLESTAFGSQYSIITMFKEADLSNVNNQKAFLGRILTEKQITDMYDTFPNPILIIDNHDIEALCSVKGIGATTANKIINRYEENKDYSTAYIELDKIGLTSKMIQKLCDSYGNPNLVVQRIQTNPYLIANEVDGVGWSKADEIALKSGYDEYSVNRVMAYITYYLDKEAQDNGNSYVYTEDLFDSIDDVLGDGLKSETIGLALQTLIKMNKIWSDEDRVKIALSKYKKLEENIAEEIVRLLKCKNTFKTNNWETSVKEQEDKQGWNYTEQQLEGIKATLKENIVLITGYGGCVDCDTEYFNGFEWKKISDYQEGDKVLQYTEEGKGELINPTSYIKIPCEELWHFETKYGLDQCLCDEHRVVYETNKKNLYIKSFKEVREAHEKSKNGFSGKFYTTFNYEGEGIDLLEFEIRLMCAVIADGNFSEKQKTNPKKCRINIKKERKKERLEWILNKLNISYEKKGSVEEGYNNYYFTAPRLEKEFTPYWYSCNDEQLKIICDEVLHWDGSLVNNRQRFFSTSKQTIDFVQFAFTTQGKRASIHIQDRRGEENIKQNKTYIRKSIDYSINITNRIKVGMGSFHNREDKTKINKYKTLDGYKYCFKVPSGMLVLRRNGKVFITGNCGKTSIVSGMLKVLHGYDSSQCALSGKASVNLTEITGQEGHTIHRLLGYNPHDGYTINKENPLPSDIIILDELSMVDEGLFYRLIQSIKDGAKLIMLGDIGQLQNIGIGNIINDLIESEVITHINLTQIHRQAKKSAIALDSIEVWNGRQIIDKEFYGTEIRGELQDLELDIYKNSSETPDKIMEHFKKLYDEVTHIMDLQVIVPMKTRGEACSLKLNNAIQSYIREVEGEIEDDICVKIGDDYSIFVGDKVMNVRNNYKTVNEYGELVAIMNGNLGIVKEILENNIMIVDFERLGRVIIPSDHSRYIELGYASTCHKMQGSGIKYVICGIDNSHYKMRTKEMIYTMMTRAKQYCVICAENKALRFSVSNSGGIDKQTFLVDFLQEKILSQK